MPSEEFDFEFKSFERRTVKRHVKRFWELFDKLELDRDEAEEWCITPQYGLNMRNVFEAIDDQDWLDIEEEIEKLKSYS